MIGPPEMLELLEEKRLPEPSSQYVRFDENDGPLVPVLFARPDFATLLVNLNGECDFTFECNLCGKTGSCGGAVARGVQSLGDKDFEHLKGCPFASGKYKNKTVEVHVFAAYLPALWKARQVFGAGGAALSRKKERCVSRAKYARVDPSRDGPALVVFARPDSPFPNQAELAAGGPVGSFNFCFRCDRCGKVGSCGGAPKVGEQSLGYRSFEHDEGCEYRACGNGDVEVVIDPRHVLKAWTVMEGFRKRGGAR